MVLFVTNFWEFFVTFLLQQLRSQPGTPVDGGSPRREEGVQVSKSLYLVDTNHSKYSMEKDIDIGKDIEIEMMLFD